MCREGLDPVAQGGWWLNSRAYTAILYLNDWRPSHGGCLRLHGTAGDDVDVEPVAGRLVVFSSQRVTHEVLPVLDGADHAARFALTLWILDPDLPLQGKT
jgi:SM-20-related protein